jgi:hypothetical protein
MLGGNTFMSEAEPKFKVLDAIYGSSFPAIRAAVAVLQRHKLDLAKYQIVVLREADRTVVLFAGKKEPSGAAKNFGVRLAPDAELSLEEANSLVSKLDQLKVVDRMQAINYPPMQIAVGVFLAEKLDLDGYKITVAKDGESVVVMFDDKDRKPGTKGSGRRTGFNVVMRPPDFKVVRTSLVR